MNNDTKDMLLYLAMGVTFGLVAVYALGLLHV